MLRSQIAWGRHRPKSKQLDGNDGRVGTNKPWPISGIDTKRRVCWSPYGCVSAGPGSADSSCEEVSVASMVGTTASRGLIFPWPIVPDWPRSRLQQVIPSSDATLKAAIWPGSKHRIGALSGANSGDAITRELEECRSWRRRVGFALARLALLAATFTPLLVRESDFGSDRSPVTGGVRIGPEAPKIGGLEVSGARVMEHRCGHSRACFGNFRGRETAAAAPDCRPSRASAPTSARPPLGRPNHLLSCPRWWVRARPSARGGRSPALRLIGLDWSRSAIEPILRLTLWSGTGQ